MLRSRFIFSAICLMIGSMLVGCSGADRPDLVEIEGTVTLDGEPLADAQIIFQTADPDSPYQRPASGKTDASGKFTMATYGNAEGVPLGAYRVGVIKKELVGELPEDYNPEDITQSNKPIKYKWLTPREYANPEDSGLTVEVTSDGMQPAVIALEGGEGGIEVLGRGQGNDP